MKQPKPHIPHVMNNVLLTRTLQNESAQEITRYCLPKRILDEKPPFRLFECSNTKHAKI